MANPLMSAQGCAHATINRHCSTTIYLKIGAEFARHRVAALLGNLAWRYDEGSLIWEVRLDPNAD